MRAKRSNAQPALIVLARQPELGRVKTRLTTDLPEDLVFEMYKAMVKDVLRMARSVRGCHRYIFHAGSPRTGAGFFERYVKSFALKRQNGADLGARMLNAFRVCRREGCARLVLIGTDCLSINEKVIQTAFSKLISHDIVLGPSRDGGYYLIGLKLPVAKLFEGIDWGADRVFAQTVVRIKQLKKKVHFLRLRSDIDTVEDLKRQLPILRRGRKSRSIVRVWEKKRR